jgi:hypothetical protein
MPNNRFTGSFSTLNSYGGELSLIILSGRVLSGNSSGIMPHRENSWKFIRNFSPGNLASLPSTLSIVQLVLVAVPVQSAAVIGPSVAGVTVEWVGSQRVLFLVAVIVLLAAWVLLQRVRPAQAASQRIRVGELTP